MGRLGVQSGLIPLFDDVMAEQNLLNDPEAFTKITASTELAEMFIGGALAFSPNDTAIFWDTTHSYSTATG